MDDARAARRPNDAVGRPPPLWFSPSSVSLSLRRWQRALWERGKRSFIAFSSFPAGRFSFLFCFFFLYE
jgi:hypothetical protein